MLAFSKIPPCSQPRHYALEEEIQAEIDLHIGKIKKVSIRRWALPRNKFLSGLEN